MKKYLFLYLLLSSVCAFADDGSRLWLKYDLLADVQQRDAYLKSTQFVAANSSHPTIKVAVQELEMGLKGLLGKAPALVQTATKSGGIILNVAPNSPSTLQQDGFELFSEKGNIVISSKSEAGVLYGAFELLRYLQTGKSLTNLSVKSSPNKIADAESLGQCQRNRRTGLRRFVDVEVD